MLVPRLPLPLIQGSLDLLVLGALASSAAHGYGVATLVRERSGGALEIEDAALYQALHRLERKGLVSAEWGLSENNRRARYYALTGEGRKRLREEAANWQRYARAVSAVLEGA
jgi:PadR family transcriptional regulator PadR